ncbi:MAG: hypothetical protein K2F57_05110 [Candidatus Gastranaerophilales bacterium]|nr:hypothetical protein [Candidatus Gastranaerophilales bacterium]
MNNSYYETLDENFTQALKLYEQEYTHSQLVELLNSGNIVQKQIAALRLEGIFSSNDAQVLVSNLTGQDGKIREAVSLRLNEFMSNPQMLKYFQSADNYQVFLDAVIDINANICRNVISAISNLKNDSEFCNIFCKKLTILTFDLLDKIEKFNFQDGKYKVNKEVFKLYWCLETIFEFYDKLKFEDLKHIILRSKDIEEYTIREKAAKILTNTFEDTELLKAKIELQNDKNYYVRRFK